MCFELCDVARAHEKSVVLLILSHCAVKNSRRKEFADLWYYVRFSSKKLLKESLFILVFQN